MRIWQCTRLDINGVGGVEKHINSISRELTKLGHTVHIGPELPKKWRRNSTQLIIHTHGDLWPNVDLLRARMHSLKKNSPKPTRWVHICHGTSVGRVLACKEYFSLSGWKGSLRDFLPTKLADAAIGVSDQALYEARRYFRMRLPSTTIGNGVDPSIFKPLEKLSKNPRIIFVGRTDDPVKNLAALVTVAEKLAEKDPLFKLSLVPGNKAYATASFIENSGELFGIDLAREMEKARAMVLCSFYEGDPIVLREAQAMGLPIIASDLPQIRQNLTGYKNAILIDPNNSTSIKQAIETALYQKADLNPKPKPRTWHQVAKEFEDFYKKLFN